MSSDRWSSNSDPYLCPEILEFANFNNSVRLRGSLSIVIPPTVNGLKSDASSGIYIYSSAIKKPRSGWENSPIERHTIGTKTNPTGAKSDL